MLLLVHLAIYLLHKFYPNNKIKVIQYSLLSVVVFCSFFVVGSYFMFHPTENNIKITYNNCVSISHMNESYVFIIIIKFYYF